MLIFIFVAEYLLDHTQLSSRALNYMAHITLQWRRNGHDSVSNHQPQDCLLNRLFRRRSKKTPKLHVTGLCAGNSPITGEFPAQMASNAGNVSIWWRHHIYMFISLRAGSQMNYHDLIIRLVYFGSNYHDRLLRQVHECYSFKFAYTNTPEWSWARLVPGLGSSTCYCIRRYFP